MIPLRELYDWSQQLGVVIDRDHLDYWNVYHSVRVVYDPRNDNHSQQVVEGPVVGGFGDGDAGYVRVLDTDHESTYEHIDDRTIRIDANLDSDANRPWVVRDHANARLLGDLAEFEVVVHG